MTSGAAALFRDFLPLPALPSTSLPPTASQILDAMTSAVTLEADLFVPPFSVIVADVNVSALLLRDFLPLPALPSTSLPPTTSQMLDAMTSAVTLEADLFAPPFSVIVADVAISALLFRDFLPLPALPSTSLPPTASQMLDAVALEADLFVPLFSVIVADVAISALLFRDFLPLPALPSTSLPPTASQMLDAVALEADLFVPLFSVIVAVVTVSALLLRDFLPLPALPSTSLPPTASQMLDAMTSAAALEADLFVPPFSVTVAVVTVSALLFRDFLPLPALPSVSLPLTASQTLGAVTSTLFRDFLPLPAIPSTSLPPAAPVVSHSSRVAVATGRMLRVCTPAVLSALLPPTAATVSRLATFTFLSVIVLLVPFSDLRDRVTRGDGLAAVSPTVGRLAVVGPTVGLLAMVGPTVGLLAVVGPTVGLPAEVDPTVGLANVPNSPA